tara:strand:- start:344 stop:748 length:405 start_codon:yes stop_codon:yes gene_type:complete
LDDEDEDDETKKIDGIFRILIGPDGVPLKRNNSDVMNNFYINYVVRSYTTIDKTLKEIRENNNKAREAKMGAIVDLQKQEWRKITKDNFKNYSDKFSLVVNRQFGIKEQLTTVSSNKQNPQDENDPTATGSKDS